MKLITLNTWGGRINGPLLDFVKKYADADIFCLQEMYHGAAGKEKDFCEDNHELFSDVRSILTDHAGYFHPHYRDFYGLAMFVHKSLQVLSMTEHFVHLDRTQKWDVPGEHPRNVQCADLGRFTVVNFHGMWQEGKNKMDTPERILQSEKVSRIIRELPGEVILAGDFNLNPDTRSLQMLEESGLRNLIKDFGITDTRTSHYPKPGRFADYVLVTRGIKVLDFKVLPDEVSDHAPLELTFEI